MPKRVYQKTVDAVHAYYRRLVETMRQPETVEISAEHLAVMEKHERKVVRAVGKLTLDDEATARLIAKSPEETLPKLLEAYAWQKPTAAMREMCEANQIPLPSPDRILAELGVLPRQQDTPHRL